MLRSVPRYLMEHPDETERLEQKTSAHVSASHLRMAGLRRGMNALDVGCGPGAVTRVLSAKSGTCATGVDSSAERICVAKAIAEREGVRCRFVTGLSHQLPFANNTFDFVWSRFLFEYLTEPSATLEDMVRVAKPGARICVADLDAQMQQFYPKPPPIEKLLKRATDLLGSQGFDPYIGRKLYTYFVRAGLNNIRVFIRPYQIYAGGLPDIAFNNFRMKFARALERLESIDPHTDWRRLLASLQSHLRQGDFFYYSTLILVTATK